MRILLQTANANAGAWRAALAAALPEAEITVWPELPPAADYLVVWKPPAELFVRAPAAKAIFNLGAGVDAVMRLPTLPPATPLVRLEDGGMATQMILDLRKARRGTTPGAVPSRKATPSPA